MPPYRASVGGMFGSGMQPRAGGGNIDIAGAINAIGNQASSLVQSAYLRKLAERERQAQADALAVAREDKRLAREDAAAQRAVEATRRAEDVAFREKQLAAQEARAAAAAQPKPVYDSERGVYVTPPTAAGGVGTIAVPNLPAKPKTERSAGAGTFYPQINPETGATTYFNPQTGVTVQAPGTLQPRDAATATGIVTQRRAIAGVRGALEAFKRNIETNGVAIVPGITRSGQETDYENLQLQMKELYNLGVLNGPDLALMRRIVNEPGSFATLARAGIGRATPSQLILAQIKKLEQEIDRREQNMKPASAPTLATPPAADRFGPRPPGLNPDDE